MEKLFAELSVKVKKENLNEDRLRQKWQQLIETYRNRGIDVNDCSIPSKPERSSPDEILVVVRSGERTQTPDYKEMYILLGEFIEFLYEEMLYVGLVKISLERKCLVFEIQTQIP